MMDYLKLVETFGAYLSHISAAATAGRTFAHGQLEGVQLGNREP